MHLHGEASRRGLAERAYAESPLLHALWRDPRRTDDIAAGGDRRRTQLGLPLLLATRCRADNARADRSRFLLRSQRVSRLAGACGRTDMARTQRPLRYLRATAATTAGMRSPYGVSRIEAGPNRQRRPIPEATRHLWSGALAAYVFLIDGHEMIRSPGAGCRIRADGPQALAGSHQGILGVPRLTPTVHVLESHVLGGARSPADARWQGHYSSRAAPRWSSSTNGNR